MDPASKVEYGLRAPILSVSAADAPEHWDYKDQEGSHPTELLYLTLAVYSMVFYMFFS